MLRSEGYAALRELCDRSVRMARIANAMLISGQKSSDREQKRLRAESAREFLALVQGLLESNGAPGERGAMVRLGGALCRVIDAAAETAILLRGRSVRIWALLDRVRMSVALTEQLSLLVEQCGKNRACSASIAEYCVRSIRLTGAEEQSLENISKQEEGTVAFFLSSTLCAWRIALADAFEAASVLLLEFAP